MIKYLTYATILAALTWNAVQPALAHLSALGGV